MFKFLSPRLYEEGLMCRADDHSEPVIQLSPPLMDGPDEIRQMAAILYRVISEAYEVMSQKN